MKRYLTPKVLMPLALVLLSVVWLVFARQLPSSSSVTAFAGPSTFPTLILGIMLVCSIVVSVQEIRAAHAAAEQAGEGLSPLDIKRIIGFVIAIFVYVFIVGKITFIPATVLLLAALLLLFGQRKPLICIAVPVGFTLAIYAIFEFALKIDLP